MSLNPRIRYDQKRQKPVPRDDAVFARLRTLLIHRYLGRRLWHALAAPQLSPDAFQRFAEQMKCYPTEAITQPEEQEFRRDGLSAELIYGVSNTGIERLLAKGFISKEDVLFWRKLKKGLYTNIFWHDAAVGFLSGSAELGCRELDLPYRSIFDMYSRHDMERPFNVTMGGVVAKPDLICEVGGSTLYVEFDRDTETKKEITNKYRRYRKIWETLSDKGITNFPKLIFVFTLYDRMLNSMDDFAEVAKKETGKYSGKTGPVYFRYMPELQFKYNRNMPSDGRFVTGEFERIGNKPIYLFNKKAAENKSAA